jgi:hypothetical protein
MNGQPAFQSSSNNQFNEALYPTVVEMNCSSNYPDFDTRVWYDDLNIKAVYGCNADTNLDFTVNVNDLLAVISAWGACTNPPCAADIDGNGSINVNDLLAVITTWGNC